MIRALRHALGAATSLAGWIVLLMPTALLAYWSVSYVLAVLQGIEAPGTPIQYEYNAAEGKFRLRAESYTFESLERGIRLNRPELLDPAGRRVARARLVVAALREGVAHVRVDDLEGTIVRRETGRFSIQDALPLPEGEPSQQPVVVEAHNVRVHYSDEYGPGAHPLVAESDLVRVSASGDYLAARADLNVREAGWVRASLSRDPRTGLQLRLRLPRLECGPVMDHAFNWLPREEIAKWQPIRADRLVARGSVELSFPVDGEAQLSGDLEADGAGVSARNLASRATVHARGRVGLESFVGAVEAADRGTDAHFDGILAWGGKSGIRGRAVVTSPSERSLPPIVASALPRGIRFDRGRFEGPVSWQSERFDVRGTLEAKRLAFKEDAVTDARLAVVATSQALSARVERAAWLGHPVDAAFRLDLEGRRISGFAKVEGANLVAIGRRVGAPQLRGKGSIEAVVGGTTDRPTASYVARGAAAWDAGSEGLQYLGLFEAGGRLEGDRVSLGRFALTSQNGAYTASGTLDLGSRALDVRLKGGAVSLQAFSKDASGLAFLQGTLRGTLDEPRFSGNAELYAAQIGGLSVPVVRSEVSADRRVVRLTSLTGENGTSSLVGNAAWSLGSGRLDGQFHADDVVLADYLGSEFVGALDVAEGSIGGTMEHPTITALVSGGPVSAHGVPVRNLSGKVRFDGARVSLEDGVVALSEGRATVGGHFDLGTKQGRVAARLEDVGLGAIPTQDSGVDIGGKLSGDLAVTLNGRGVQGGSADLKVAGLVTNGWVVGDGSVKATGEGEVWTGDLGVGANDRFLVGENLRYDARERLASGDLSLLNIRVEDVLAAVGKARKEPTELERRVLEHTSGLATAFVSVSGRIDDPNLAVKDLTLNNLEVVGRKAGTVAVQASRNDGVWHIDPSKWTDGSASVRVQGTIDREGRADLSADVDNFDLEWLQVLGVVERPVPVEVDSSVALRGQLDNPTATGSLRLEYTGAGGDGQSRPTADFDTFELRDRVVRAEGVFLANSFTGKVAGRVPLATLLDEKNEGAEPVSGRIDLLERDVNELTDAMPWLDTQRTAARLGGWMSIGGTPEKWVVNGQATVRGERLAAAGVDTALTDVDASAVWDAGTLRIRGQAKGSKGGDVSLDSAVTLGELLESGQDLDAILSGARLSGALSVGRLKVAETLEKGEKLDATLQSANVRFGGTVKAPTISGEAVVAGADVAIPTIESEGQRSTYPINPRFDNFVVRIEDRAKVRAAATVMDVTGRGSINGTLQDPRVVASLTVLGGVFSLPTAPITLEEGGTMAFRYESSPNSEPVARLDLNLEGRTSITARRLSDVAERYDVTLGITGNLLENQGLTLRASSDPPELSQDEILAILGQKDLIEQVARGTALNQQPIREMLYSFALPALSSSLTRELAFGLGLDQLAIEYNAYDNFTFTASKTLAKGLTLVGRGQLVKPVDGPSRWEVKLTYRLPSRNVILSRTRLGVGIAYDRPWRITLDYTVRF